MMHKQEEMDSLLQLIEAVVWEADIVSGQFTFISDRVLEILGFPPGQVLGKPGFWGFCVHPDDRHIIAGYQDLLNGDFKSRSFKYRIIKSNGHIAWVRDNVSIVYRDDKSLARGIMLDITITERLLEMERLEGDILRLNSDVDTPLQEVLHTYLSGLEALFPQMLACTHRVKNGRLVGGVSASLDSEYLDALDGTPIGKNVGSCGSAAALNRQIIVKDIATDPKWEDHRSLALKYQLRACWSNPVTAANGEVLATVSMYYKEPKMPSEEELKAMERATALLRVILENRHRADIINEGNLLMLQSQELAHFGNWHWDIQQDVVRWSPALYSIYGLNPDEFKATFAGYQERLHPDDRIRIYQTIENVLKSKLDAEFEERIIRPNGEVRHLRSWAKLRSDPQGHPVEMIGACLDITEKVKQMEAIEHRTRQL
jgi:PAS domain S-box-containing protein